ncbi:hypothetical protein ACTFIW_005028 [Dictyostelium discoideum]
MAPPTKELTNKEITAIKGISKLFDDKKYSKGLKECNAILKNHPDNPDASCFKSLILYNLEQQYEARENAIKTTKTLPTNSMAWHTLGYIHKLDKNYLDATTAFKNASKFNKESSQILKELAPLQLYSRDLEGLKETYATLLKLQPTHKPHWTGLVTTYQLMGQTKSALSVFERYLDTLEEKDLVGVKKTESLLYRVMLNFELEEYDQALDILVKNEKIIIDKLWAMSKHGDILLKKGELSAAEAKFKDLIKLNQDDLNVHKKLWESKNIKSLDNLSDEEISTLDSLYKELGSLYPKSLLIQKIPLLFLKDKQQFREHAVLYTKNFLSKGIPSLFNNLKCLYNNKEKVEILSQLFLDQLNSLKEKQQLLGSDEKESPSTVLWCLYYLAQHFDRINDHSNSLSYINQAIEHTPTCLDLYVVKAKLYKHQGDLQKAYEEYDRARNLDLADRYLNTKCALYALRNNDPDTAEAIFSLIKDETQTLLFNIQEFQCIWYERELGKTYLRAGDNARAIKLFNFVDKNHLEYLEDQMDFHNHINKKLTMRSYIEFLRWEDQVYQNKPYIATGKAHVKAYLNHQNKPEVMAPLKKVPAIKKPAPKPSQLEPKKDPNTGLTIPEDDDLNGKKFLVKQVNLMDSAQLILDNLLKNTNDIEIYSLACQVNTHQKKYLLVLKSLVKIKSINENSPCYYENLVNLMIKVSEDKEVSAIVKAAVEKQAGFSSDVESILANNQTYLEKLGDNVTAQHRFVVGKIIAKLSPSSLDKASELILNVQGETSWKQCADNLQSLSLVSSELTSKYREKLHEQFPIANYFQPKVEN